jgi:hypothetical protein
MTRSSPGRRKRRLARRGRPVGELSRDPQRFSMVATFAFLELGCGRYTSACLAAVLFEGHEPITIEQLGPLMQASSTFANQNSTLTRHAEWLLRKIPIAFPRASDSEREWVAASSAAIMALVEFLRGGKTLSAATALDFLVDLGWGSVLERIGGRLDAALRSNFPPAEGRLSAAGGRMIDQWRKQWAKNGRRSKGLQGGI